MAHPAALVGLVHDIRAQLAQAPHATAPREAEALVAAALGLAPPALQAMLAAPAAEQRAIGPDVHTTLAGWVARRLAGEPLAYVLGFAPFWHHDWVVAQAARRVLIPRPDSEVLVAAALEILPNDTPVRLADVGVGSGCLLGSVLAERPACHGVGTDCDPDALALARANLERVGVLARSQLILADMLGPFQGPFDVVISNPPYIGTTDYMALEPQVRDHEPRHALEGGPRGVEFYEIFAPQALARLVPGGALLMEIGPTQAEAVAAVFRRAGFMGIGVRPDLAGRARVVHGVRPAAS